MLFTTTATIQGREVERYVGIVFGDAVLGVNLFKDFMAAMRDLVGGRSATYERELGSRNGMLMVSASGTAVLLKPLAG